MIRSLLRCAALVPLAIIIGCSATQVTPELEAARLEHYRKARQIEIIDIDELERATHQETFAALRFINDPIAPFNRFILRATTPAINNVILPVARAFRSIVPTIARVAIERVSYNLSYPSRFVSLVLQGEAKKAGSETAYFVTNSTLGVAGIFDPAARFGMSTYPDDVGLAFARWGIGHGFYLFLPIFGPSSGRDTVGHAFDLALNPLFWIPAPGISVLSVNTAASLGLGINSFTFQIEGYERLNEEFSDPYEPARALWSIGRQIQVDNFRISAEDFATADPEPSLGVLLFRLNDPGFAARAVKRRTRIAATGRRLPYSVWMQPEPAPLLFLLPGVGAHRLGEIPVGLAEEAFARGYSVVSISSPLHPEFMVAALSKSYPGFTPSDAEDLHVALTRIWYDLRVRYGDRITEANLMGYSLGAIETLFLAAAQPRRPAGEVKFKRFIAINPPVDLLHAGSRFDAYFDAPLRWPLEDREANIREVVMKAFLMTTEGVPEGKPPPFDRLESEFLVGFTGRATLANTVATVERMGAPGLTGAIPDDGRSNVLAASVLRSSFDAYFEQLALPYFAGLDGGYIDAAALAAKAGLRSQAAALQGRCDTFVVTNADDFILADADQQWLRDTFAERLTVFPDGGHLGNIHLEPVQDAIFDRLAEPGCR